MIDPVYEATGGYGNLVGTFKFGTLADELTRKNLTLFADAVLPEVRSL